MHSQNPQRILIVEDDPDLSRVLTRSFRLRNIDATSAPDLTTAQAAARAMPPDYAIIDLCLGTENGMTLIKPLKNINPAMRILMLSGYPSIATAVDSIKLGANHFMVKPAYIEEIIGVLGIVTVVDAPQAPVLNGKRDLISLKWKQIMTTLRAHDGNISATARALGMYRRTLQRKLEAHREATGKDVLEDIRNMSPLRRCGTLWPAPDKSD